MRIRQPALSEVFGKRIVLGLSIVDMTGFGMAMMSKQVYSIMQRAAKMGSDNYPEIMGNMFVVNAPMMFTGVWSMCKGFLDERTRNKI